VHAIVNGWETSGNATFSSGFPLTVTISGDRAGTGSGSQRPNVVGALNITANIFGYFNTAAFALITLGTFGNEGSNVLRGPGISNSVNLNFLRNISFGERARLRIGAECFNIFNHANFSAVGTVFGSATFGNLTAALDPAKFSSAQNWSFEPAMPHYTRRELLGIMAGAALSQAAGEPPPNILYMMADDHAAHAISAYGSKINRTPNIDRIANQGVRLTNCFCTNSICAPSRAAILTG
jgi:hypothetical protein